MHVQPPDSTTLDPWHGAIVDAVCASDAARVAAGETSFLRPAVDHELCTPGGRCLTWTLIHVVAIAPGIRMRRPIASGEVAA